MVNTEEDYWLTEDENHRKDLVYQTEWNTVLDTVGLVLKVQAQEDEYWLRELEHTLRGDDDEAGLWIFGMDFNGRVNSHAPGVERQVLRLQQACFGPRVQFEEENKFFELYQEGLA